MRLSPKIISSSYIIYFYQTLYNMFNLGGTWDFYVDIQHKPAISTDRTITKTITQQTNH